MKLSFPKNKDEISIFLHQPNKGLFIINFRFEICIFMQSPTRNFPKNNNISENNFQVTLIIFGVNEFGQFNL